MKREMKVLTILVGACVALALMTRGVQSEVEVTLEEAAIYLEEYEEEIVAEEDEDEKNNNMPVLENYDDVEEDSDECSRISPKEVFYTDLHPRLLKILDEISHYVEAVVIRIEDAVEILQIHVPESPLGELKSKEVFPEVQGFLQGTIRQVYEMVRSAWRDLMIAHIRGDMEYEDLRHSLELIKDAQEQGDKYLNAALQELSITIKAIIMNSIYVVHRSLKLPNDTEEGLAAKAIYGSLHEVAPNFLGTIMARVLERGSDPSAYKKILTDPLRDLNKAVDQMQTTLEAAKENGNATDMAYFWREAVSQAHQRMRDDPLLEEDFEIIYSNEVYLTELTLSLVATF